MVLFDRYSKAAEKRACCSFFFGLFFFLSFSSYAEPFAYIANQGGSVSVIDTASNSVVKTITIAGTHPYGVTVSPFGDKVYVGSYDSDTVAVISTVLQEVIATIPVSFRGAIVASPNGERLYVAGGGSISVIDALANSQVGEVYVGGQSMGIAISPDSRYLYVANTYNNRVDVVDTQSNAIIISIPVNGGPWSVAVSPNGSKIYVGSVFTGIVHTIDATTNTISGPSAFAGAGLFGLAVSHDGLEIYVANRNYDTVYAINAITGQLISNISVGQRPYGLSVSLDGSKVYVANSASNTVSVIDAPTKSVISTVGVGDVPTAYGNFIAPLLVSSPTIAQVEPSSGSVAGGTEVILTGDNFYGVTSIKIGENNVSDFTVNAPNKITLITPPGLAGSSMVLVTGAGGVSQSQAYYSYIDNPIPPPQPPNPIPTLNNWAKLIMMLTILAMVGWHVRQARRT